MTEVEKLIEIYKKVEDAGLMVIAGKKDSAELMVAHDVVPVVRCKECKNRDDITGECKHPRAVGWDVIIPEDNDFCSYGERKGNG